MQYTGEELRQLKRTARLRMAAMSFWEYCKLKDPKFYKDDRTYLHEFCDTLQQFAEQNETELLIVACPPRVGKSYTLQHFTQWLLGNDPSMKIMTASYNEILSTQFAKEVRNAIMERKVDEDRVVFSDIFPDVKIKPGDAAMNLWSLEGHYANYLATSPTGTATGFGATCFPADTVIMTDKGEATINEIYNNISKYKVLSYNKQDNTLIYNMVSAGKVHIRTDMIEIILEDGTKLHCTSEHPIYVVGKGWMVAKVLTTQDKILQVCPSPSNTESEKCEKMRGNTFENPHSEEFVFLQNTYLKETRIKEVREYWDNNIVYDIQVENEHNFFANGILVHNCIIIDDLIKNSIEAYNERVKEEHYNWFATTMRSRLEEGGKIIICATRWHRTDLSGRVQNLYDDMGWTYKEVKYKAENPDGSTICEEILSKKSLEQIKHIAGEEIFMANYQQSPIDAKGRLYTTIKIYDDIPKDGGGNPLFTAYKAYIDTADKGADYLCCIAYGIYEHNIYILDVIYNNKPMEITETLVAQCLNRNKIKEADIESNNGGRGFARNVDRILKEELNNHHCVIHWFTQTHNKEARILSNATTVMEHVHFPKDWTFRWPEFADAILSYQKEGKNMHDDGPDCLTGTVEKAIVCPPIKLNPAILHSNRY